MDFYSPELENLKRQARGGEWYHRTHAWKEDPADDDYYMMAEEAARERRKRDQERLAAIREKQIEKIQEKLKRRAEYQKHLSALRKCFRARI